VKRNQTIVEKYVGTPYTVSWPCAPLPCWTTATWFQVELVAAKLVDPATPAPVLQSANITMPTMSYTFTPAKAGLFYARVRACDLTGCSQWINSWDPANTDPASYPRGFLLRTVLPPATGGGVN
jgi:hypothetical protein